ncbi:hypothetical protein CN984_29230 [Bacillus cereus]|uniref:Peptidase S11 D-alanyl-D-alanine carboxypeptidase A N-terminal domain-containing protein n=1 Tax=Bacillus cereus TaxID=1396 RepID=A0A2B9PEH2_BACCE|nr:hypothetical protein [Bacillus cereus]PGO20749.1 hypothetical protein CN984_29230 [Bacillus cereus]
MYFFINFDIICILSFSINLFIVKVRLNIINLLIKPKYFNDGLKTGFTDEAGYCFTGTAKQGERRMISVVMGTSVDAKRFIETKKLFSYGFHKVYIPFFESVKCILKL